MFANEILACYEEIEIFFKYISYHKNLSIIYGLLVKQWDSLMFELNHALQDFIGKKNER